MNNKEYVYSVNPLSLVENEYSNKLNNFITTSFDISNVLKLNNFRNKYASFAHVVAGKNITSNN